MANNQIADDHPINIHNYRCDKLSDNQTNFALNFVLYNTIITFLRQLFTGINNFTIIDIHHFCKIDILLRKQTIYSNAVFLKKYGRRITPTNLINIVLISLQINKV